MTPSTPPAPAAHALWVRLSHGLLAASLATLVFSGLEILMVHPLSGGHFRRHLVPNRAQRSLAHLTREVRDHLRLVIPPAGRRSASGRACRSAGCSTPRACGRRHVS